MSTEALTVELKFPERYITTLPGTNPQSIPVLRDWIAEHLAGTRHDLYTIQLCTVELATNAIRHSRSGAGLFDVWLGISDAAVRVLVVDDGPLEAPVAEIDRSGGNGLTIVAALTAEHGAYDAVNAHVAWFEIRTPSPLHPVH